MNDLLKGEEIMIKIKSAVNSFESENISRIKNLFLEMTNYIKTQDALSRLIWTRFNGVFINRFNC